MHRLCYWLCFQVGTCRECCLYVARLTCRSAVPTYLTETGMDIGDRGPANAFNAILLIGGVPVAYWVEYSFTKMNNQSKPHHLQQYTSANDLVSWRLPIVFQCIFAIISGGCMYFLPDTPRWYYARNRPEEGDAVLCQLHDAAIDSPKVQQTRMEIMNAIEIELEANSSLHWKQFLTFGVVDKTELKIIRRIMICFWLPMVNGWAHR
jgi:hypothetical protein